MSIQGDTDHQICGHCPSRTPFMADPENLRRARDLHFEPPLDEGVREIVETMIAHGIETFESCQGGEGHVSPEPIIRFEGGLAEGPRAFAVAVAYRFPVNRLRRAWGVTDGMLHGPWWEMTFSKPRPVRP